MRKIKLFFVVGLIVALLSACGSSASSLVGRWQAVDKGVERISELEFFSDGTYTSDRSNYNGSYSVDGNRMRLSGILVEDLAFTFDINGSTLTIYNDSGTPYEYSKIGNE